MKAKDAFIEWTPMWWESRHAEDISLVPGSIRVAETPVYWGAYADKPYLRCAGAYELGWRHMTRNRSERKLACMFIDLVVRDGMDPQVMHKAFLQIDEYRQSVIGIDVPGATDKNDNLYVEEKKTNA